MVAINRLNQIAELSDKDLSAVWQSSSGRTRSITIANLRKFIQSTDPNSDAFVKAELIGDELVLTSHDDVETRIDINLLPEHSVTELKDIPDTLLSGQYLKVNDAGDGFVLTPSSEIAAEILIQSNDEPATDVNVLKFTDGVELVVENKIATIKSGITFDDQFVTKIYTENDLDVLIEDEVATITANNKVSRWPLEVVDIGDSPKQIDKIEQLGIEYQFGASSTPSQSMILYHNNLPEGAQIKVTVVDVEADSKPIDVFQIGGLQWPVITPTVFTLRSGAWRVEESSQLLHVSNATTFDDDAARKKIVHGVALGSNSSVTMDVNDDGVLVIGGGGETPDLSGYVQKYKRADLDYLRFSYGGKYDGERVYYPAQLNQDGNGWTHLLFTGYMQLQALDKATGEKGDVVLQLRGEKIINKVQPYYNDYKLAVRANNNIANTSSLADVINSEGQSVRDWKDANPDYEPHELLEQIFTSTVTGFPDFEVDLTLSSNDYNGAVPSRFGKWTIRRSPDATRGYMYVHIKESNDVYRAPYIAGVNPVWSLVAYRSDIAREIAEDKAKGVWVGGVIKDTVNDDGNPSDQLDCVNPKHWIEFRKTSISSNQYLVLQDSGVISSEVVIHLHAESGMTSCQFRVQNSTGQYQDKTIRLGEKWRFFLREGVYPYSEKIDDGMQSGNTSSDFDGEGFGVPGRTETGHGVIVQKVITGNYRNTSNETGDLTINLRTDDGVQNFRLYYSMPHGTLSARKVYVKVDEKAGLNKTIRAGEIWQCEVKAGRLFDDFFWSKVTDGESTFEAIDTSSFDPEGVNIEVLKKSFTDKDLVSIPLELPDGFNVLVSSVICKLNGKLKKQPFEYHYENGILRVHLNEVCSGIIIAELIR